MDGERLHWVASGLDYKRLTDWEAEFVEKVEERFKKREKRNGKGYVTEGEEEILERLYREKGR